MCTVCRELVLVACMCLLRLAQHHCHLYSRARASTFAGRRVIASLCILTYKANFNFTCHSTVLRFAIMADVDVDMNSAVGMDIDQPSHPARVDTSSPQLASNSPSFVSPAAAPASAPTPPPQPAATPFQSAQSKLLADPTALLCKTWLRQKMTPEEIKALTIALELEPQSTKDLNVGAILGKLAPTTKRVGDINNACFSARVKAGLVTWKGGHECAPAASALGDANNLGARRRQVVWVKRNWEICGANLVLLALAWHAQPQKGHARARCAWPFRIRLSIRNL